MSDDFFTPRRVEPLHAAAPRVDAAEDTLETNDLQEDAAEHSSMQQHSPTKADDFTNSVEQVREHFRAKGLMKSKDTVQRWCRAGDLDCKKRGVLGRYFATETSLLALEKKLLPDMIAENAGAVRTTEADMQPDAAALERTGMQVHEAEDAAAFSGTHSGATDEVQLHEAARSEIQVQKSPVDVDADRARLQAENEGLRSQLENRDKQIDFLQDEIRSGREQRGAVVQISNRMLETLETMAIGGRLDRPKQQGSAPEQSTDAVRYEPFQPTSG